MSYGGPGARWGSAFALWLLVISERKKNNKAKCRPSDPRTFELAGKTWSEFHLVEVSQKIGQSENYPLHSVSLW
jgi:hypothetical protein